MAALQGIWKLHGGGRLGPGEVVRPDERLAWGNMLGLGAQHVLAMFGSTALVPVLVGFPPATTIFFSGVGTLLFLAITGNRVPSYTGPAFPSSPAPPRLELRVHRADPRGQGARRDPGRARRDPGRGSGALPRRRDRRPRRLS